MLVLICFLPSALGFTGTLYPDDYDIFEGFHRDGTLDSFTTKNDNDVMEWEGESLWPFQFYIKAYVYFPYETDTGTGNTLEMRFAFDGGNNLHVRIIYTDLSYDDYQERDTSYKTVIYELDNYKSVDYVYFWNYEWWSGGYVWIDYFAVHY